MRLTAHQTGYLPGLRLLHKIALADLYCHFDIVPLSGADGWEARNKIKTQAGEQWLTVPCNRSMDVPLKDVQIAIDPTWRRKHKRSIELAYAKAPFFDRYWPTLEFLLSDSGVDKLSHLNLNILYWLMAEFDIKTKVVKASDYAFTGAKSGLVLDMCKTLGATHYTFGSQGKDYAEVQTFTDTGISVEFQDYQYPVYPQLHGAFVPNLTALDLLLNCGPDSRRILLGE